MSSSISNKNDTYTPYIKVEILLNKIIVPLLFFIAMIWTLPLPEVSWPISGLDPSWRTALYLAVIDNLQFGRDLVFSYGILGFLSSPLLIDYDLWKLSLLFQIAVHVLFYLAVYLMLKKLTAKWYHYLIMLPIMLFSNLTIDELLPVTISIILFTSLITKNEGNRYFDYLWLTMAGLSLAVASHVKFNSFIVSLSLIAISLPIFLLIKKDFKPWAYLAACSITLYVSIWILSGQLIVNLWDYIRYGLELSNGYTAAMSYHGPLQGVIIGLIAIFIIFILLVYSILGKKHKIIIFLVLNSFILFAAFKHGFVRHDLHSLIFYNMCTLLLGITLVILLIEVEKKKNRIDLLCIILSVIMLGVLALTINSLGPWALTDNILHKSGSYMLAGQMLIDETKFDGQVQLQEEQIRKDYPLDNSMLDYIDQKTIDILPWDLSLCRAYGFNWSPRLVIQSYSDYTQTLDQATSEHFAGNDTPQVLLYYYEEIDNRYPLYDEPATFREILENYQYMNMSGDFIVLNRTKTTPGMYTAIATQNGEMGQWINVPAYDGAKFAKVNVNYNLFGKLTNLLYKPAELHIQFKLKDGTTSPIYRFIPDVAKNGIFVSQYVNGKNDIVAIFSGDITNNIDSFRIYSDDNLQYSNDIQVQFIGTEDGVRLHGSDSDYSLMGRATPVHVTYVPIDSSLIVNGEYRRALFEHPMLSDVSTIDIEDVYIPPNSSLEFDISLDPFVWSPDKGDGVQYEIYVLGNGTQRQIFSKYIDPKSDLGIRKWNTYALDMDDWAWQNVTLRLETNPGPKNDDSYDWAYWSNIEIKNN